MQKNIMYESMGGYTNEKFEDLDGDFMKKTNIFGATFEESLNFEDDPLLKWQNKNVEKPGIKERPVLLFIIASLLVLMLYGMYRLTESATMKQFRDSPIPKADINFLPSWLFWLLFLAFVSFWIYTHFIRIKGNRIFWSHVNANNILLWLVLEFNLMFVTMLLKILTGWGILLIYILMGLAIFWFLPRQIRAIQKTLFSLQGANNPENVQRNKIINFILVVGGVAFLIYMILKLIFPSIAGIRSGVTGFIQIVSLWIVFNLGFILMEIYVELPYQLQHYYINKYSEEYRQWQGKNQLEWYGARYFNKHIKGTNKEEKMGKSNQ